MKARAEWLSTITKISGTSLCEYTYRSGTRFAACLCVPHSQVIDLALDAPDLATFQQELKACYWQVGKVS